MNSIFINLLVNETSPKMTDAVKKRYVKVVEEPEQKKKANKLGITFYSLKKGSGHPLN